MYVEWRTWHVCEYQINFEHILFLQVDCAVHSIQVFQNAINACRLSIEESDKIYKFAKTKQKHY